MNVNYFSIEYFIQTLETLDELSEWAKLWDMEEDELVKKRRVEILQQMASTSVFTDDVDMPVCTET